MTQKPFSQMSLPPDQIKTLETFEYKWMTPIQEVSIPFILDGKDDMAQAITGSGKTAAFVIPLLQKIAMDSNQPKILTICPTRELAEQVSNEFRKLSLHIDHLKVLSLVGGKGIRPQIASLAHGANIVVGTPGRILKLMKMELLSLAQVEHIVIDEADKMLNMGFVEDIEAILPFCAKEKQILLFSATFPKEIQRLAKNILREPEEIFLSTETEIPKAIQQHIVRIDDEGEKYDTLVQLLLAFQSPSTLVFCHTKKDAEALASELNSDHFQADSIHGDLEQKERDQALVCFKNKSCPILVATDVAARGLDIDELPLVIVFELSKDPEIHIHRVGRTGRAGNTGRSISIVSPKEEVRLEKIETLMQSSIPILPPEELETTKHLPYKSNIFTLCVDGGKKNKLRKSDIVGALLKDAGLVSEDILQIDTLDFHTFLAIRSVMSQKVYNFFKHGKIKGKSWKIRQVFPKVIRD